MALRTILTDDEEALHKKCRPVTDFDERLWRLLDDMADTLAEANGVGLAGPQVGILRRLFIMDTGEGLVEAINPVIMAQKGEQEEIEGCLSCPGKWGYTHRPMKVVMKAQDRFGKVFTMKGEALTARCICHENDHLDGVLFTEHVTRMVDPSEMG